MNTDLSLQYITVKTKTTQGINNWNIENFCVKSYFVTTVKVFIQLLLTSPTHRGLTNAKIYIYIKAAGTK